MMFQMSPAGRHVYADKLPLSVRSAPPARLAKSEAGPEPGADTAWRHRSTNGTTPWVSGKGTSQQTREAARALPDHRTIRPGRRCGRRLPASAFFSPRSQNIQNK